MNDNCKPLAHATRHAFTASVLRQPRWKFSALAAALVACAGLHAPQALALTLGPITVQSALGEPLRAEIDLAQITPAEAESLRASTAAADVFRTQGMEYSAIASQMRVQLHRRPDGRMVLRLSGNSPVNEPFVDLVIDARWSAGQVTRSYTMLFDPPVARRSPAAAAAAAAAAATTAPVLAPSEPRPAALAAARRAAALQANASNTAGEAQSAAPEKTSRTAAPARNRAPAEADGSSTTLQVRSGDTAGSIASARRPQGVSLDQMLVAMVRANPDAFIQGNVNRLKAGSVLQIPDQEQALATPAGQARQLIAVQSRDFNDFRRRLAGAAPAAEQAPAQRSASGSVQTRTEDASAPASAADKLTLSKGAMQGQKTTEEMLAERKQGNAAAARTQEMAKNIEELNRLNAATGTAVAPAAASAPVPATLADTSAAPVVAVANPGLVVPPNVSDAAAPVVAAAGPSAAAAANESAAAEPALVESAAAAPPATPAVVPAAVAPEVPASESSGFMQDLLDQPALPLVAIALLLLLAYGGYRSMQRRRSLVPLDSGFADSRVQPDSFFGASGGQHVDTANASSTIGATSQLYSHSQLDTGGEVDPVAEADVYLAYGRDLQAEEILREAARTNPTRVPIFVKLGEIYAKRLDRKGLEAVASDVYRLTQGQGVQWEQMANLGRTLDPGNKLYQPGGISAATVAGMAAVATTAGVLNSRSGQAPDSMSTVLQSRPMDLDLDLDLDFDLPDDALTEAPGESRPSAFMPQAKPDIAHAQDQDWDALEDLVAFNAAIASAPATSTAASLASTDKSIRLQKESFLDLDVPDMDAEAPGPDTSKSSAALQAPADLGQDLHLEWEELPVSALPDTPQISRGTGSVDHTALDEFDLNLELPGLDGAPGADSASNLPLTASPSADAQDQTGPDTEAFVPSNSGLMDFDFNDLSLDLESPNDRTETAAPVTNLSGLDLVDAGAKGTDDPLATKLSLAQEFHAIGDSEGARTLVEEVIADSSGTLKARARQLLAEMD